VRRRFGSPSPELAGVMTQAEVAAELGITRSAVSMIERSAFRKLRCALAEWADNDSPVYRSSMARCEVA
jgi:transcriptional regulator with XRE-family HTH domain